MKLRKTLVALSAAAALALTACGGQTTPEETTAPEPTSAATTAAAEETLKVGIIQYVSHEALDAVAQGFEDELEAQGYGDRVELDLQNSQADQATLTAIANEFAQDDKDLILAIATPAGQAAAQAMPDVPVVFAAVTDPVAAELVDSWEAPGGNVTGVSDMNPVEEQLKLLLEIAPDVKSVGIVFSSGEVNAEVQVAAAEEAAPGLGLTIVTAAVSNSSEVQQAAESLDVDAFYIPTDNTVVSGLEGLLQVAETKQLPVISSDVGSVERGAIASQSVDYIQQGKDAATMAIQIFEGADPASMAVQVQEQFALSINPDAAERMGVTIPDSVLERAVETF